MKWRVIKIVVGLLIVAFLIWFGSHLRFTETKIPLPLKGEAITNPFYAAIKLAEQLGAKAEWERVFSVPATNSVVMLSNWNWTLSRTRRARLEKWVENGGRLVVDQSLIGGFEEFEKWSGVGELVKPETDAEEDEPVEDEAPAGSDDQKKNERKKRQRRLSDRERALIEQFIDVDCSTLTEDVTNRSLSVCGIDASRSLTSSRRMSWALREGRRIQALRVPIGRGSVTVINASPFRYRTFLEGDHPTLLVAATQLHRGDSLLFLTEEDHASLLTLVWRFGAPVVLLLAALIVLSLWRNTTRFGPLAAPPEKARRSLTEQIRGTGLFTLRFGGGRALHEALVRALREAAIRRLPAYDRMPAEERIAAIAKLTGVLESDLGPALNYSGARSAHELRNVIAVLETARRRLSISNKKAPHGN